MPYSPIISFVYRSFTRLAVLPEEVKMGLYICSNMRNALLPLDSIGPLEKLCEMELDQLEAFGGI